MKAAKDIKVGDTLYMYKPCEHKFVKSYIIEEVYVNERVHEYHFYSDMNKFFAEGENGVCIRDLIDPTPFIVPSSEEEIEFLNTFISNYNERLSRVIGKDLSEFECFKFV